MKRSALIAFSISIFFLAGLYVAGYRSERTGGKSPASAVREEERRGNQMDPREYIRQLRYVREEMPAEYPGSSVDGIETVNRWECIGPSRIATPSPFPFHHGRARAFHWYTHPVTGDLFAYAGASSGGLWKCSTALVLHIWQPIGDKLPNPAVGAFAVNPEDPNVIFVGTGDWRRYDGAGLFKTTDEGNSWSAVALQTPGGDVVPTYITDLFYDPLDPSRMWLSSDKGLFLSVDGGNTFLQTTVNSARPSMPIFDMVADPQHPDTMFVAGGEVIGPSNNGIWRTTDGGTYWSKLGGGLPATNLGSTVAIDISLSDPSILYAGFTDMNNNMRGVYKSINGGAAWSDVTPAVSYIGSGQGFHTNVIRIHPTNPNIVYAGSVSLVKTTDGGSSWIIREPGHGDLTAIDFQPSNPRYMYLSSDGGIIIRDDSLNYTFNTDEFFSPGAFTQFYTFDYAWSDPSVIVGGTQDNGTIVSVTGPGPASTWKEVVGCDGWLSNIVHPTDPSHFFFTNWCGGATIQRYRSLDLGDSKEYIGTEIGENRSSAMSMNKQFTNYLFTVNDTNLYYSSDEGSSWHRTHAGAPDFTGNDFPRDVQANSGVSGDTILCYVLLSNDNLLNIRVAGGIIGSMSWRNSFLPAGSIPQRIRTDRWLGQYAYAFSKYPGYRVFKTTNGGFNWTNVTGNLPLVEYYSLVSDPSDDRTMYIGTNIGVFKTTDNGAIWSPYQLGLPVVQAYDLAYVPGTGHDTLRVATYGRGVWQRALDGGDPPFVTIDGSTPLHGIGFLGPRGIGVSDTGRVVRTSDAGITWHPVTTPLSADLNTVGFADSMKAFVAGKSGQMAMTTDGGGSWVPLNALTGSTLRGMKFTAPLKGFAFGDGGVILGTTDGGSSWQNKTNPFAGSVRAMAFNNALEGWAAGGLDGPNGPSRLLLRTTDGGQSWAPDQGISGAGTLSAIGFSGGVGVIVGDSGTVFRSTDGGQSWKSSFISKPPRPDLLTLSGFVDPELFVGGKGGAAFHSPDLGATWIEDVSGVEADIEALATSGGRLFAAGAWGVMSRDVVESVEVPYLAAQGWNLLSRPTGTTDSSVGSVFTGEATAAFAYDNGYTRTDSITVGRGYWVKFPFDQSGAHVGNPVTALDVPVAAKWNLVGSISSPVPATAVQSTPVNIISSPFYRYAGGYSVAETLKPGEAYWVKAGSAGTLTLKAASIPPSEEPVRSVPMELNSITVTDAEGRRATLFFAGGSVPAAQKFELPPVPPERSFDVRFSTGLMVECADSLDEREIPIAVSGAHYPLLIAWNIRSGRDPAVMKAGGRSSMMASNGLMIVTSAGEMSLVLGHVEGVPKEFSLSQNYPNPFNPATTIRYDLPVRSRVDLKIFDMLGREVATLVGEVQEPGYRAVPWTASSAASGVYFYRLEAVSTTDPGKSYAVTKKMLHVK